MSNSEKYLVKQIILNGWKAVAILMSYLAIFETKIIESGICCITTFLLLLLNHLYFRTALAVFCCHFNFF